MAKLIYIAIFLFASYFVASEAQQNCSNVVAQALGIPLLPEPAARPAGVKICGKITGDVCCGADTFAAIETAFNTYRSAVDTIINTLKNTKMPNLPKFDELFASIGGCKDSFFADYDLDCDDVEKMYNKIVKAFKDYYEELPGSVATCMQGLLEFYAGIICFLCDASWGQYITVSGVDIVFNLSTDVCDDVAEACLPLYQGVQNLYEEIVDAVSQLGTLGQSAFGSLGVSVTDICNEDCRRFICYVLISGYDTGFVSPIGGTVTGRSNDEETPIFFRNMRNAVDSAFEPIQQVMNAHHTAINTYARTIKAIQAGESQYSANGYAATEVGRDSSLNTEVEGADGNDDDSSASKLFAAILAVLAALALLF